MSGELTVTEAEWLACIDPDAKLRFLSGKVSSRKMRLFWVACCRRIWHLLEDKRSRKAVAVVERWADGLASEAEVVAAYKHIENAADCSAGGLVLSAHELVVAENAFHAGAAASRRLADLMAGIERSDSAAAAESICQSLLLPDIFGNPFQPVTVSPDILAWKDGLVVCLAQTAYNERHLPAGTLDSGRLAILADALEEAGCTDAEMLDHLRSPGPHVRGCWAVDSLLGKS